MNESKILTKLRELEEEIEALRLAFQSVLWSEAYEANDAGRAPLLEGDVPLAHDEAQLAKREPRNERAKRVLNRAQAILAEARPTEFGGDE